MNLFPENGIMKNLRNDKAFAINLETGAPRSAPVSRMKSRSDSNTDNISLPDTKKLAIYHRPAIKNSTS